MGYAAKLKRHDPNTNLTCYDCGQSLASFTGLKGHVKRRKHFPMPKEFDEYFDIRKLALISALQLIYLI